MNKVFIGLVVAVCLLGMALVMLNNRLGRSPDAPFPRPAAENRTQTPSQIQMEADARAREIAEAASRSEIPESPSSDLSQQPDAILKEPAPIIEDISPHNPLPKPIPGPEPSSTPQAVPATVEQDKPAPPKPALTEPAKIETPLKEQNPPAQDTPEPVKPVAESPKQEKPKENTPASQNHSVTRFVVFSREKGATIRIAGNGKMEYGHMVLENPDRVVLDVNGNWKFPATPGIPKNELVESIRVGKNGPKTRVVIDMKEKPRKVQLVQFKDGSGVDIRVDK